MAKLTGQSIASSYDQLLIVTGADGVTSSLQAVESADTGGAVASLQISTVGAAIDNPTASSATQGGKLTLFSDDGAALGDTHRLGVLEFSAAEDTGSTLTVGASIDAFADGAWDADSAGTFLKFSTTPTGNSVSLTERMRINSVGNIGVGVVPEAWNSGYDGLQIGNTGSIAGYATSGIDRMWMSANAYVDTSDGYWQYINTDTASQYEQRDGVHNFFTAVSGSADATISWVKNMGIATSGDVTVSTGNLVIGTAGKGIDFSAYATSGNPSSNLLDDYEEGTFTPTVSFAGGSGTVAYDVQSGQYTKIGNRVFGAFDVRTTDIDSRTGTVSISGLPFDSGAGTKGGMSVVYATGLALPTECPVHGFTEAGTDYFYLWTVDSVAGGSYLQYDEWTDDGRVQAHFQYII